MGEHNRPFYGTNTTTSGINDRSYRCRNNEDFNHVRYVCGAGCETNQFPIGDSQDIDREYTTKNYYQEYSSNHNPVYSYSTQPTSKIRFPACDVYNRDRICKASIPSNQRYYNEGGDYSQKLRAVSNSIPSEHYKYCYLNSEQNKRDILLNMNKLQMSSIQPTVLTPKLRPSEKSAFLNEKCRSKMISKETNLTTQQLQEVFNRNNKLEERKRMEEEAQINMARKSDIKMIHDICEKRREKFRQDALSSNTNKNDTKSESCLNEKKDDIMGDSKLVQMTTIKSDYPTSFTFNSMCDGPMTNVKSNVKDNSLKTNYKNTEFNETYNDSDSIIVVGIDAHDDYDANSFMEQKKNNDLKPGEPLSSDDDDDDSICTKVQNSQKHDTGNVESNNGKYLTLNEHQIKMKNENNTAKSIPSRISTVSKKSKKVKDYIVLNESRSEIISVINEGQRKIEKSKYENFNRNSENNNNNNKSLQEINESNNSQQQHSSKQNRNIQIDTLSENKLSSDFMKSDPILKMFRSVRDYHLVNIAQEVRRIQYLDVLPEKLMELFKK